MARITKDHAADLALARQVREGTGIRRAPAAWPRPIPWYRRATTALYALAILAAIAVVTRMDVESARLEAAQYCELVKLGKDTKGDAGWPDYAGTFAKLCTPAGKLRDE